MNAETENRDGVALTLWEALAYDAIKDAAAVGLSCPLNLDLEMLFGCGSTSVAPSIVARLERKGMIVVKRFQRFREVQIVATGQWTARSGSMHVDRPHVPRGMRSRGPLPTERKFYRKEVR